ncbi:MAG: hypothetical protein AAF943_12225 [Pseudomonadota bacterium]
MQRKMLIVAQAIGFCLLVPPGAGAKTAADGPDQPPLSVIDWLEARPDLTNPAAAQEPPITNTAAVPDVAVQPLDGQALRVVGLVPARVTGLPDTLWRGSQTETLVELLADLPDLTLPAAQSLLYTLLLTEALPPLHKTGEEDDLVLARVSKLQQRGALDPALALIEQADVRRSSRHFDLWMQISLLKGTEDRACDILQQEPHLTSDYSLRSFCAVRSRAWEDAALTFASAQALDLLTPTKRALLDRFLHPEAAEAGPPLSIPPDMDPLSFRLFESIGEPLSTVPLPLPYAVADLRRLAGWKAQLEAAERLTRAGALPGNHLLGLYSERKAAASGGVWDRVAAWQRFETALKTGSDAAVSKTLPEVWQRMQSAQLEVPFADLFAARLGEFNFQGAPAAIVEDIALLSASYETAAQPVEPSLKQDIAMGSMSPERPVNLMAAALYDGFSSAAPRPDLVALARETRLGEAILRTLSLLHQGAGGNTQALTEAIATLRALGLEDTARRAALQILILER